MKNRSFLYTLSLGIVLTLSAISAADAQTKPKVTNVGIGMPKTAIFIGNSFYYYNNSMHNQLLNLSRAADPPNAGQYRASSVTISGSGFDWHDVDTLFRPNAIGRYSFDANNNVVFNKIDRLFDLAIMMDCSQCPIHPQLKPIFHEYAKKHSDTVRKHGSKPVFFMSWAYADKPEMTAQLAEEYTVAGNANDAFVIPAGLAFAKASSKRPDINLYAADKRHPSGYGTYLAAATIYAALYKKSPIGNTFTSGIDAPSARFLQGVAWETVEEYFGGAPSQRATITPQ